MLSIEIEKKVELIAALKATAIVAPTKDVRSYLNGVLLEVQGHSARLTASDGHRILTCRVLDCFGGKGDQFSIILPTDKVPSLVNAIMEPMANLDFVAGTGATESILRVVVNNDCVLSVYGVPGRFPEFRRVIDMTNEAPQPHVGINPAYLADAKAISKEFAKAMKQKHPGVLVTPHGRAFYITFDCFDAVYLILGMTCFHPYKELDALIADVKQF